MTKEYSIKARVWQYPGMSGWHFVTLPLKIAKDINFYFSHAKKGWGSLPVKVVLGETIWQTSIFPDKETKSYVLPLKAIVRKKEGIKEGNNISFKIEVNYSKSS